MAKNTAPKSDPNVQSFDDGMEDWVQEQIGFPPYWDPEEGDSFVGVVQNLDVTDENFPRYIVQLTRGTIRCSKGAKETENYQEVDILPGDVFSMSEWEGINRLKMAPYIGLEIKLTRLGDTKFKDDEGKPRTFINWDLRTSPKNHALALERKQELTKALSEKKQEVATEHGSF